LPRKDQRLFCLRQPQKSAPTGQNSVTNTKREYGSPLIKPVADKKWQ
jgi:hypothetical protein